MYYFCVLMKYNIFPLVYSVFLFLNSILHHEKWSLFWGWTNLQVICVFLGRKKQTVCNSKNFSFFHFCNWGNKRFFEREREKKNLTHRALLTGYMDCYMDILSGTKSARGNNFPESKISGHFCFLIKTLIAMELQTSQLP